MIRPSTAQGDDVPHPSPQETFLASNDNLYADAAPPSAGERFDTLLVHRQLVVERIVSSSDTVPALFNQRQDEWVMLAGGTATLEVNGVARGLSAGDHVFLPAGTPHRVIQVSHGAIWLAVHLHPDDPAATGQA